MELIDLILVRTTTATANATNSTSLDRLEVVLDRFASIGRQAFVEAYLESVGDHHSSMAFEVFVESLFEEETKLDY